MKKRKIVAGISVIAVLGLLVGFAAPGMGGMGIGNGGAAADTSLRTVTLEKGGLTSSVSATGTVYSAESTGVYSSLSYPVKTVYVKVGDRVEAGDLLAELDTDGLTSDIAQKKASISSSQASAQQSLATAKQDLETYQNNVKNNMDSSILNAESAVRTAELEVDSATTELSHARRDLRDLRNDREDQPDDEDAVDSDIQKAQDTVKAKEIALEKAKENLDKAKKTLEATKNSSGETLTNYQNKVASAELNTNFNDQWIAVSKLESDLEKCSVTAPVSGTVTHVKAEEGASGSGLLFVIQDADNLKILTNIKEYDIGTVQVGDKVVIKTDATGNKEYEGVLSKIAPTSTLTGTGETTASTDAEYESEVTVVTAADGLRIGMNARLSVVTEERLDVYSLPYEAVEKDGDGSSCVYEMVYGEDGSVSTRRIPVETGLETNLYIEVSGQELSDGMQILKNAQNAQGMGGTEGGAQGRGA